MKKLPILLAVSLLLLSSCTVIKVGGVVYQSLQSDDSYLESDIPADATIIVYYDIDPNGNLDVKIKNNTDRMMVIDRTQSFFTNKGAVAECYYDPTVRTETNTVLTGSTTGATVNLGAVANAVGVGGALGSALSGVNVGGANTTSVTNTNTTYYVDQPRLSIPPHGTASMGRLFHINGVGHSSMVETYTDPNASTTPNDPERHLVPIQEQNLNFPAFDQSPFGCNVCVAYSTDEGQHFETILCDIYCNAYIAVPVRNEGYVNEALRVIYQQKPNALVEPWYRLLVVNNISDYYSSYFERYLKFAERNHNLNNFGNNGISFINYR